jgi:hypothetical protein
LQWPGSAFDPFTSLIKFFNMSNFDHGVRRRKGHSSPSPPNQTRCLMPEFQPVSSAQVSTIERPRCPRCQHDRMLLSKLEAGPSGFDYRTFECQKCGCVETFAVSRDPMSSGLLGWLAGELRPPK